MHLLNIYAYAALQMARLASSKQKISNDDWQSQSFCAFTAIDLD